MDSAKIPDEFNTNTPGLSIIKKELKETKILDLIDDKFPKHSGFPVSKIVETCIYKNIRNIKTFTETSEEFLVTPEHSININRTTLARNCKRIGKYNDLNFFLMKLLKPLLKKFKVKPAEIRIIVDETTIKVSKDSKYEGAGWVYDSAENKVVWGFNVTIIALSFKKVYLPIHFELGKMSKKNLLKTFLSIREITKSNIVTFYGGYACDEFYRKLTEEGFILYSKVPKDWIFNNGLNMNVEEMKNNLRLKKKENYAILAYRVEDKTITDDKYYLCFKEGDPRILITNNISENKQSISKKCFKEFKGRWDIETCNLELKASFCFENLPVRNKEGILGYLLTSLLSLIILTIIKLKHRRGLGKIFNKGFKKFIRFLILIKAKWDSYKGLCKLNFLENFKFKWFYSCYGFV